MICWAINSIFNRAIMFIFPIHWSQLKDKLTNTFIHQITLCTSVWDDLGQVQILGDYLSKKSVCACISEIDSSQRPPPSLLLLCATHYVLTTEKYIAEQTHNAPTDRTEQVNFGRNKSFFNEIQTINTVLWLFNVSCSTSVQAAREVITSSSWLVIAWNKHEWISEGTVYCFTRGKTSKHTIVKFKPSDMHLLSSLVCLSDKNGRFSIMIGQITCQSNSWQRVN